MCSQVLYDPSGITYEELLKIFFGRHDPTQANGQGNDKGPQYRAGVYYHDEEQVIPRRIRRARPMKEEGLQGGNKESTSSPPASITVRPAQE